MDGKIMQLTYDQLLSILGQYNAEGQRTLPPEVEQFLSTQQGTRQGDDVFYDFGQYDNQYGSAPIGANGQPMFEPTERGWGGGLTSLGNAVGVLGGTAALGNLAMPYLAGGGAAAPAGSAAALGGGSAAAPVAAAGLADGALGVGGYEAAAAAAAAGAAPALGSGLLNQAGNFLGNNAGALLSAGLGAAAGIAGNGDLSNTDSSALNSTQTGNSALSGTSTNSLAPWLQGYAQDYVGRARGLLDQGATNPDMQMAQGQLRNLAQNGNPLVNAGIRQQQSVISGDYLGRNPFIDDVAKGIGARMGEAYATGTRGSLTSNAQLSGNDPRYSSAYQQTVGNADRSFGDALGQTMSGLYANNYQNERQNQNQAAQYSTNLANFGVANTGNLLQSGVQQNQMPWQNLQQYGQAINPAFGSTATTNQTGNTAQTGMQTGTRTQNIQAPNNWMAGLGGAAAGAGIYRNLFGG
jgi:hypothetical protein